MIYDTNKNNYNSGLNVNTLYFLSDTTIFLTQTTESTNFDFTNLVDKYLLSNLLTK